MHAFFILITNTPLLPIDTCSLHPSTGVSYIQKNLFADMLTRHLPFKIATLNYIIVTYYHEI